MEMLEKGFDTNFTGDEKAEMVTQLEWILEGVKSGEIVSYMACGVRSNGDIFGAGLAPRDTDLSALHDSIMQLHETFHDCVDAYLEENGDADSQPSSH